MTDPVNPPSGWYDDGRGALRYWDGTQWTEHTAPLSPPADQGATAAYPPTPADLTATAPYGAVGPAEQYDAPYGTVPPADHGPLKDLGVRRIFTPSDYRLVDVVGNLLDLVAK